MTISREDGPSLAATPQDIGTFFDAAGTIYLLVDWLRLEDISS
jgi:hypothetical protein